MPAHPPGLVGTAACHEVTVLVSCLSDYLRILSSLEPGRAFTDAT